MLVLLRLPSSSLRNGCVREAGQVHVSRGVAGCVSELSAIRMRPRRLVETILAGDSSHPSSKVATSPCSIGVACVSAYENTCHERLHACRKERIAPSRKENGVQRAGKTFDDPAGTTTRQRVPASGQCRLAEKGKRLHRLRNVQTGPTPSSA